MNSADQIQGHLAMDSYRISRLINARHREVKEDIIQTFLHLGVDYNAHNRVLNVGGKDRDCYLIQRPELDDLISKYDDHQGAAVLKYWHGLADSYLQQAELEGKRVDSDTLVPADSRYSYYTLEKLWANAAADLHPAQVELEETKMVNGYLRDEVTWLKKRIEDYAENVAFLKDFVTAQKDSIAAQDACIAHYKAQLEKATQVPAGTDSQSKIED